MRDYQQAADDAATIAETVKTLGKLLDRFHARHGEQLYEEIVKAFPLAGDFGGGAQKPLEKLARSLVPPDDDYDRRRDDRQARTRRTAINTDADRRLTG